MSDLKQLGLSNGITRALYRAGVRNLDDLRKLSDEELLKIRRVGPITVKIIKYKLKQHS